MDKREGAPNLQEKFPNFDHILKTGDGWLSPSGIFIKCKSDQHDAAANFIVESTDEFNQLIAEKKLEFEETDAERFKIQKAGYVLIRGNVLHTSDPSTLSSGQIDAMKKSRTLVISPFDATKVDAQFQFAVRGLVDTIKESPQYKKIIVEETVLQQSTIKTLNEFAEKPFLTEIETRNAFWNEDELANDSGVDSLPQSIFKTLSEGYFDEMQVVNGRYVHTFRVIDVGNREKMIVQKVKYNHDGASGGSLGAVQNFISIFIVDENKITNAIKKKMTQRGTTDKGYDHKIILNDLYGYFGKLTGKLPKSITDYFPISIVT